MEWKLARGQYWQKDNWEGLKLSIIQMMGIYIQPILYGRTRPFSAIFHVFCSIRGLVVAQMCTSDKRLLRRF